MAIHHKEKKNWIAPDFTILSRNPIAAADKTAPSVLEHTGQYASIFNANPGNFFVNSKDTKAVAHKSSALS